MPTARRPMTICWPRRTLLLICPLLFAFACGPVDPGPTWVPAPCDEQEYPEQPYGTVACDTIENSCFAPVNAPAIALAGDDGVLSLSDLFADESIVGVLLFGTAGWCTFCTNEGASLNTHYPNLQNVDGAGGRIELVAVVFQDDYGEPADVDYAAAYADHKDLVFPAVADTTGEILEYFDASAAPGNIFIRRSDMTIIEILQGYDEEAIARSLNSLDGSSSCR